MSDVLRQLRQQRTTADARPRLMERYAAFLPVNGDTPNITLGEGYTPLVHARNLGRLIGCPQLHLKVEGMNPTGSFKDRGMVVAVAKAMEEGARAIICASTGNTAASAAAYGAAVGLEVVVVIPEGQIAAGKLLQAQAAGAKVVAVKGNFDAALAAVRELVASPDPDGATDRHARQLGQPVSHRRPENCCLRGVRRPGWRARLPGHPGRQRGQHHGLLAGLQRLPGRGPGRDAAAHARLPGRRRCTARQRPHRSNIRRRSPRRSRSASRPPGEQALQARDESGGVIEAVTDEEIMGAYRDLARHEGIFCEPASAASLAGVRKMAAAGRLDPGATIVCVLTGHGLKDPDTAQRLASPPHLAGPSATELRAALGW